MKFGRTEDLGNIDFTLPPDSLENFGILEQNSLDKSLMVYVGCAKWNKAELKNFYPRGTKDELAYYSTQFNSIELNATFYRIPDIEQVVSWKQRTPDGFRFFPKVNQRISHLRRLKDVQQLVEEYCDHISHFEEKLGMAFLQLHNNFGPKNFERMVNFVKNFPVAVPLAVEIRNTDWVNNPAFSKEIFGLFEDHQVTNILVDTAGRRDLLHMRLTTPVAFVRYVGANDPKKDRERLDEWVVRLKTWRGLGLREIYFFVHQNIEMESPLLSAYFIGKLNEAFGLTLQIPKMKGEE
jgi:uncharacterized protein YecE (DUF72 family)